MHNGNTRGEQNGIEDVFEAIIAQNFPKLMLDIKLQIQKGQNTKQEKTPSSAPTSHSHFTKPQR